MPGDPVEEAFKNILGEVYWSESLEEAEEKLARFLESIDPDLRELLLERRRRFCGDAERIATLLAALAEVEEAREAGVLEDEADFIGLLVASSYIMQCTRRWSQLTPRAKARILAPLYRASYAMEQYTRTGRRELVEDAAAMVEVALRRAAEEGVLDEVREFVEKVAEKLAER